MKSFLTILLSFTFTCCLSQKTWATEDDPVKVAPKNYHVILENSKVRVLDARLRPGEKSAMHTHPDYTTYTVTGGVVKFTDDKGKSKTVRLRTGQTMWHNDESHSVENVGKTTIHVIVTELKGVRIF